MAFKSYAQNFEDVILWRVLNDVDDGFYIDVGAQDPVVDSVSFGFYEQGWRGIHFEPTNYYSKKLKDARPDELVMQVAIGNSPSELVLYEFESTGLSTGDKSVADTYINNGRTCIETTVPTMTLDSVFMQAEGKEIHWLKVDVEGMELLVLQSWKKSMVRPWVVVIESTLPGTQIECFEEWEPLVLNKGYDFVYFDGLNRYYLSHEHKELTGRFRCPPNIFDDFVLSGLSSRRFFDIDILGSIDADILRNLKIELTELVELVEFSDLNENLKKKNRN